ncbi:hypothetical protein GGS23DRAFT_129154 [Durotheca rogersii]|uniref:uncharacterized protein n=1 Tax=Durotheca rogersii TaxID=419775 RepID=UPI00221E9AC2|nr:uncharacterized protein GGS23DRAFT_129154 [Durotheca rogersii]KAI5861731.1 hypothetical protein GGS23DRAFT_129154 [Durotheca rogersii]
MKKFGFGKKQTDGDDDPNRSALFGKKGSGPSSENPYAQSQPANDPYTTDNNKYANVTPYQKARSNLQNQPVGLPSGPGPRSGYGAPPSRTPSNVSSATAPPPYSNNQPSGGYANDRYGTSSGYGNSKYGSSNSYGSAGASAAGRVGGYGGLGRTDSNDTDANRDALFSGAQERLNQRQTNPGSGAYGASGADSGASKYGGYGEQRELTQEDKDYEEYKNIKQEIRDTTKASVASTENSLRALNQSLDVGMQSYARLGAQNERLHHTDQLLDTAIEKQRHADVQTKKLKTLNRSMFAVHVKNPFTEKRRTAEEEAKFVAQNQADREIREATRRDKFAQSMRMESTFNELNRGDAPASFSKPNRNDRNKYTLEDDSDEEGARDLENDNDQIESNLAELQNGTFKLNRLAKALGEELDHGNRLIDGIGAKTEPLDDQLKVTNMRLERIGR